MAVGLESLINPDTLTTELAIMIIGMLALYLFAALRLRSAMTIIMWFITVISLILAILVDLSLAWFWVGIFLNSVVLVISMIVYTVFNSKI